MSRTTMLRSIDTSSTVTTRSGTGSIPHLRKVEEPTPTVIVAERADRATEIVPAMVLGTPGDDLYGYSMGSWG